MTRASISLIQTGLRDLGHDPGPVDGLFGPRTRAGATAWLDADGRRASAAIAPQTNAMIYQGLARHPVLEAAIHCSATRPAWMADRTFRDQWAEIRRWHVVENGWRNVGYHWGIARDGAILPGRPETEIGAGILGHNPGVIHICLIGGHGSSARDRFAQHFTPAQDVSLRQLLQGIKLRTRIEVISGHNEYDNRACPGFTVSQWLQEAA